MGVERILANIKDTVAAQYRRLLHRMVTASLAIAICVAAIAVRPAIAQPPDSTPTPTLACLPTPVCDRCLHAICDSYVCPQRCVCEGPTRVPTCTPGPICQPPAERVCDVTCSERCTFCQCVTRSPTPTPTEFFPGCCLDDTCPDLCGPTATTPPRSPTPTPTQNGEPCAGDCNGDGVVGLDEVVEMVGITLGSTPADVCPGFDCSQAGCVSRLIESVNHALLGCPDSQPTLSLALGITESSEPRQAVIVATLRYLRGPVISYLTGCTAQCDPTFIDPITLELSGPDGEDVMAECVPIGPLFCAEYFMQLAPGDTLAQTLVLSDTAWKKDGGDNLSYCGDCTPVPLATGLYSIVARFQYRLTPQFADPVHELSQTLYFNWSPP